MSEPPTFFQLINLEKACPRRTLFQLNKIEGVSQFFYARKKYERNKILEYLIDNFSLKTRDHMFRPIEEQFIPRLEKNGAENFITNLEIILKENPFKILEVNIPLIYSLNGTDIELFLDGIGTFRDEPSIFKFNLTTRFSQTDAFELICAENALQCSGNEIDHLIVLFLGTGNYREIIKGGDLTKSGTLSKKGLPPWDSLREEANDILTKGLALMLDIKKNPKKYNNPEFGTCLTCPYHNIEVEYDGEKIICTG